MTSAPEQALPPLYAGWVRELLGGPIPRETEATCAQCAMWPHGAEDRGSRSLYFDPVIKCCTYVPNLSNFLVGRILSDTDPAARPGRASVERRIAAGIGVTPLGVRQSPIFKLLYENSSDFFGRARALVCPHYLVNSGGCGIWRHRSSTCATWFCKHVRGQLGYTFWRDSLHWLLHAVEDDLARWCLLELQPGDEVLRELAAGPADSLTGATLDHRVDEEAYARAWGEWQGHERQFFLRCAALVEPLSWSDVLTIAGPQARSYAELTRRAYARLLSDDIPPALEAGSMRLVQMRDGITRVSSYSTYDPLDVPGAVMELLRYFDGRPTADALAAIARERGLRLEPALVRKMVDFGLLVPPKPASGPSSRERASRRPGLRRPPHRAT